MTRWLLDLTCDAEDDLARLDFPVRKRILERLEWTAENFDTIIPLPLTGEYRDFYKLRVGDWRIFYKVNHQTHALLVCYIDRRDKAYKKRR